MTTNLVSQNQYQPMMPYQAPVQERQGAATEVNAVKIELIEPKAYNGTSEVSPQGYYSYPQTSMYAPSGMPYPYAAPQMPVMMPQPQVAYPPQQPIMMPQPQQPLEQPIQQQPQAPVIEQPVVQQPMPPVPPAVVETPKTQPQPAAAPVEQPVAQQPQVAPQPQGGQEAAKLIEGLNAPEPEAQFDTINKIAELAQSQSPEALALVSPDTFKGLSAVVTKDTSTLPGPDQEQSALREKAMGGQQLSAEEKAKAEKLAPQEMAEMNKQYALYTLAILGNAYRDGTNAALQQQGINEPLKINEIPEINLIIDTIKDNSNPLIREAGISALDYLARPEDKEIVKTVLNLATQDADESVKKAASDSLTKMGEPVPAPAPEGGETKKTRKEEKAEKKAAKEAEKQQKQEVKNDQPEASKEAKPAA